MVNSLGTRTLGCQIIFGGPKAVGNSGPIKTFDYILQLAGTFLLQFLSLILLHHGLHLLDMPSSSQTPSSSNSSPFTAEYSSMIWELKSGCLAQNHLTMGVLCPSWSSYRDCENSSARTYSLLAATIHTNSVKAVKPGIKNIKDLVFPLLFSFSTQISSLISQASYIFFLGLNQAVSCHKSQFKSSKLLWFPSLYTTSLWLLP